MTTHPEIIQLIETNFAQLKQLPVGQKTDIAGFSFRSLQKSKNLVQKVEGPENFYLKIRLHDDFSALEKEAAGMKFLEKQLQGQRFYLFPQYFHVNMELGYILSSEIRGRNLKESLHRYSLRVWSRGRKELPEQFFRLGQIVAQFQKPAPEFPEPSIGNLYNYIQTRVDRLTNPGPLAEKILNWLQKHPEPKLPQVFVHGNLKLDNVISLPPRLSIMDFETAGSGAIYNDPVRVLKNLILAELALGFPTGLSRQCANRFLDGYRQMQSWSAELMEQYIKVILFDHYLQYHCIKKRGDSLSGFPIRTRTLEKFCEKLLSGSLRELLPWLRLECK
ncbi:MAG: hypothetical protein Kow0037_12800 [Calditrichia bacterium]